MMTVNNKDKILTMPKLALFTFKVEFSPAIEKKQYLRYLKTFESMPMLQALQSFNFKLVLNNNHLESAVWHAILAKQSNRMISKSLSVEILLYLSCQRQIHKAIEYLGLTDQITSAGIAIIIDVSDLEQDIDHFIQENFIKEWNTVFKDHNFTLSPYVPAFNSIYAKNITSLFEIPFSIENISEKKLEDFILSKIALLSFQ